jgi:hypothetical protein
MGRRASVLHPFLVALFPVLSLAASNALSVNLSQVWRTSGLCLVAAGVLWVLLRPLAGSWTRAGILASVALLVFFSYGQVRASGADRWFGRNRYLLPMAIAILLAAWIGLRRARVEPTRLAQALTVLFAFLVGTSLLRIGWSRWKFSAEAPGRTESAAAPAASASAGTPDVYYIILDGYAGARALREIYGFDNTPFLDELRRRGFTVADRSRSNYSQTPLSLASSTNMDYIPRDLEIEGQKTKALKPLYSLIEESRVMQAFRRRGYKFVSFQSGWTVTGRNRNADWDVNCGGWEEFNRVLARTTLFEAFDFFQPISSQSRDRLLCEFQTLGEIPARVAAPRYVFAHFVSPEPPLLFGRDGQPYSGASQDRAYVEWKDKPGYVDQVVFCSRRILATIDRILAQSPTPPIIVLQSDHGSAASDFDLLYGDEGPPATGSEPGIDVLLRERMEILNAYRIPGGAPSLYPSITPVNSFRVVLNDRFGEKLPLLPDRSYFSRYAHPYRFLDVTDRVAAGGLGTGTPPDPGASGSTALADGRALAAAERTLPGSGS